MLKVPTTHTHTQDTHTQDTKKLLEVLAMSIPLIVVYACVQTHQVTYLKICAVFFRILIYLRKAGCFYLPHDFKSITIKLFF